MLCLSIIYLIYIWLGTHQQLSKLDLLRLSDEFPLLTFSTSVRDLGVILDQELSFTKHISLLSRSCYYHLRQLRVVSRSLSVSSATALVHAFVCCRLDYCSSLYIGLPLVRTNCLVRVLRSAARLVGGLSRYSHVSRRLDKTAQDKTAQTKRRRQNGADTTAQFKVPRQNGAGQNGANQS